MNAPGWGLLLAVASASLLQPVDSPEGQRGTVRGEVALLSRDGEPVTDRSGVVVFLEGPGLGEASRATGVALVLQEGQTFYPSVLPIVVGTRVDFPNRDDFYHNIFSLSPARPFDLDVYPAGESRSVVFPETGLVDLFCNIHPDMAASVLVLQNSFFAVTGADGRFSLEGVPPGRYRLRTWHRFGGDLAIAVDVASGTVEVPALTVREERIFVPHLNKFGRRYRRKY